jgi:hypothetical protein
MLRGYNSNDDVVAIASNVRINQEVMLAMAASLNGDPNSPGVDLRLICSSDI